LREALLPEDVLRPALVIAITVLVFFGVGEIGAEQAVIVFTLVAAAALALGLWWLRRHMPAPARSAPSRYRLRVWLITSLPMCGASLLQEVLNRCDALLLGWWSGVEQAGVYSAAARVALLSVLLLKVVDTVVAPQIASAYFGARTGELRATFRRAMLLSGAGALPLFLIMFMWPERIMSMFGEEFVAAATLLQILAVGQFVNAVTGPVGNALLMTGHEKQYFNVMLFCAAANVLGNLVAIPVWGMAGAAVVTASNVALMNLLLLLRVRRIHFAKSGHAAHG
jgi:O-antigen/teichoic acid export membrane protein